MKIHASAENYLESILILQMQNGYVRSVDIANSLGFSKPSVSVAMKLLKENRYITVGEDGRITLTETGMKIASRMYERYTLLTQILMKLGVDEETARNDACRIEHVLSDTSFEMIKKAYQEYLDKPDKV
ncbi:MAG: metal-dependent transcriptional regulator [Clostridiales bacterium]|nr:metal-dependent transcriptional regulator [Clostridiales bacterium]